MQAPHARLVHAEYGKLLWLDRVYVGIVDYSEGAASRVGLVQCVELSCTLARAGGLGFGYGYNVTAICSVSGDDKDKMKEGTKGVRTQKKNSTRKCIPYHMQSRTCSLVRLGGQ